MRNTRIKTTAYADLNLIPYGFPKNKLFYLNRDKELPVKGAGQYKSELETKELKKKIAVILEDKGYSVAEKSNADKADYLLSFNYGCLQETVIEDALKYAPGPTYVTNATVKGHVDGSRFNSNYQETTTAPGTFFWVPERHTYFTKGLYVTVVDKKRSEEVWQGVAFGVDAYDDLRSFLDFLLVSIFDFFGHNGASNEVMHKNRESVDLLRRHMARRPIRFAMES